MDNVNINEIIPIMSKCPICGDTFTFRKGKIYCNGSCRFKAWDKLHKRVKIEVKK